MVFSIGEIKGSTSISNVPSGVDNISEIYLVKLEDDSYAIASDDDIFLETWFGDGKGEEIEIDGAKKKVAEKIEISEPAEKKLRALPDDNMKQSFYEKLFTTAKEFGGDIDPKDVEIAYWQTQAEKCVHPNKLPPRPFTIQQRPEVQEDSEPKRALPYRTELRPY